MKDIRNNRFLVWLMWLVPIAMTGWWSVYVWTIVQIIIYVSQTEKQKEFKKPVRERRNVVELNKQENLTERDKQILDGNSKLIKVGKGVYYYERK